jgi:hypothetical protein
LLFLVASGGFQERLRAHVLEAVSGFATDMPVAEYEQRLEALEQELPEAIRAARAAPLLAKGDRLNEQLASIGD